MIDISEVSVYGFYEAAMGMRNPKKSWHLSDTSAMTPPIRYTRISYEVMPISENVLGINDKKLALKLASAGGPHAKFRRMIQVWCDIYAPLYWWKEFDTYKIGTTANSESTMHTIGDKPFGIEQFSVEELWKESVEIPEHMQVKADGTSEMTKATIIKDQNLWKEKFKDIIECLNIARRFMLQYRKSGDKEAEKFYWWKIIQMLPSSWMQMRTENLNYEVLSQIHHYRKDHKLTEWRKFCNFIEQLPDSEIITCERR